MGGTDVEKEVEVRGCDAVRGGVFARDDQGAAPVRLGCAVVAIWRLGGAGRSTPFGSASDDGGS